MSVEALRAEYLRALDRERLIRDVAFLPVNETIAGYEARPMTLRHYLSLRLARNPFVCGGTPLERDAFLFLWQVSPSYSPADTAAKRRLYRRCRLDFIAPAMPLFHLPWRMRCWATTSANRAIRFVETSSAIADYYREATMDWPSSRGGDGKSYYSEAAGLCHEVASKYGWTIDQVLDCKLKALFQLLKIIRAEDQAAKGKQPIMFNQSDELLGCLAMEEDKEHGRNN